MSQVVKVDSNSSGLRYSEEASIGVLPAAASQNWYELEPNTYPDFGGQIVTVARNPINAGRQRKKGGTVNVTAAGGFNTDLTQTNLQDILQGFMFADFRKKHEFTGLAQTVATSDDSYSATGIGTGAYVGDLIFASGYTNSGNNGLHRVTVVASGKVSVAENLTDETSPTTAKQVCVGFQFATADLTVTNSGSAYPTLGATAKNLTELGINPGEWIYIGGDLSAEQFATAANNNWVRVRSVTSTVATLDKTTNTMVTDAGAGKTIRIFKGRVLKNETGTSIKRRTYTLERSLGYSDSSDVSKEQAEYLVGAEPNQVTFNMKSADKVTADVTFEALSSSRIDENVSGANTLLSKVASVTRIPVVEADMFNTSSDFSRIRLSTVSLTSANPSALFTYSEDISLVINNNVKGLPALGVLGAFELSAGTFTVGGTIGAYFGNIASINSVIANDDVTLDVIMSKGNSGVAIDIPLITLGNGKPTVAQDEPIKIPLDTQASTGAKIASTLNHTLMMSFFDYLPTAAAA